MNDKLLISQLESSELFVYSREGYHLYNVSINGTLFDALWTHRGNIVYTTSDYISNVALMSESGYDIQKTQMNIPRSLSISSDGIIYVADEITGLYQSTDHGFSWNIVFKPTYNEAFAFFQLSVRVTNGNNSDFWTIEQTPSRFSQLCVYRINYKLFNNSTAHVTKLIAGVTKLAYDGNGNVFLYFGSSETIHVYSVTGQYRCLIVSLERREEPKSLVVDHKMSQLYVGISNSKVRVFKLIYGDECALTK